MITTSTGAKKLESSDNWREIFPNPGTSAAGAHNASVDAHDRIQAEVAPIINGKRCSLGAASGEYVLLRNSTLTGKSDGAYQAAQAIPANTDLDSTYLGSPITGGIVNELNSKITQLFALQRNPKGTAQTISAGNFQIIFPIGKTGYTPIAIASWNMNNRDGANNIAMSGMEINSYYNEAYLYGKATNAYDVSASAYVEVLYIKNA